MFCDKLDFLMKLTDTTNSVLGTSISLVPSHISRLRSGKRSLPKNPGFLKPMSNYFAAHINTEEQLVLFMRAMKTDEPLPEDIEQRAELIMEWLEAEEFQRYGSMETFMAALNHLNLNAEKLPTSEPVPLRKMRNVTYYFGMDGKREAVVRFLTEAAAAEKPQTLLLYSDESMTWLSDSEEFTRLWAELLFKVIQAGNQIKIIHTISRNADEMFHSIAKWLPAYMTGAIQPYYCPRVRDGIFFHTMFIAPQTAAVTVTTSRGDAGNTVNEYHTDKRVIASLTEEYEAYLSVCRPLVMIYMPEKAKAFRTIFSEFDAEEQDTFSSLPGLSPMSMPADLIQSMAHRLPNPKLMKFYQDQVNSFEKQINTCFRHDIMTLPDLGTTKERLFSLPASEIAGVPNLFYTKKELKRHLEHVIELIETHEKYRVTVLHKKSNDPCWIYAKEGVGAVIVKQASPAAAFVILEQVMVSTFLDYLRNKAGKVTRQQRDQSIMAIRELIAKLD